MFRSATVKLTAWYAGIIIVICLLFSVAFYEVSVNVVNNRLLHFQGTMQDRTLPVQPIDDRTTVTRAPDVPGEVRKASAALFQQILVMNVVVIVVGTGVSYLLARRTLRPVEEAHVAQARFVSDASHELRTPLSVMKSELEVSLRDNKLTTKELRAILKSNLEEVESLARMSEVLLAMSRMEHTKLVKQKLDLKLTAAEAIYRFRLPTTRLKLTGKTGLMIDANEPSIIELMTILVDNALKYSPDKTQVLVRILEQNSTAVFEVNNQGNGIDDTGLDHIFDRFYRGDGSRTDSKQKGFGLGLSIAKQIADMHNAEITATSDLGKTTTFQVLLQKIN